VFTYGTSWTLKGGLDTFLVGVVQGLFSYPFFDPVLMDRTMLSDPLTMLKAYWVAGIISIIYILFFGIIGVYGKAMIGTGDPFKVAQIMGNALYQVIDITFITSSISALDSCFSSTARVIVIDCLSELRKNFPSVFKSIITMYHSITRTPVTTESEWFILGEPHMLLGRVCVVLMAVVGTLPLLSDVTALDATTVSGTVVMGMGPPIIFMVFWKREWGVRPMTFIVSWIAGLVIGVLYQVKVPVGEYMGSLTHETRKSIFMCICYPLS
jgi:Na+/proline symporter